MGTTPMRLSRNILLVDFSGYYANIPHDKCLEVLQTFLEREVEDPGLRSVLIALP